MIDMACCKEGEAAGAVPLQQSEQSEQPKTYKYQCISAIWQLGTEERRAHK